MTYNGYIGGCHKGFKERACEKIDECKSTDELEKVTGSECDYGIRHGKCHMNCDRCCVEHHYNNMKRQLSGCVSGVSINKIVIDKVIINNITKGVTSK